MSYKQVIESLHLHHFSYREIVNPIALHRKMSPPEKYWKNISPTLFLADELRVRVGHPLTVVAAYRPYGGAEDSQHRYNRALDLDIPRAHRGFAIPLFRRACAEMMSLYGKQMQIGMGFYKNKPYRVHIDTGYRLRDWHDNIVFDLIADMGLEDPRK